MPTHYTGCAEIERALNAYINFVRAANSVGARLQNQIESSGLTTGQFAVLEALLHLGPMCQRTLGRKLLRSGGNVTVVVDNLQKRGWVRRERQKNDRRQVVIHLTSAGRHLIGKIFPQHARVIAAEMSRLSPTEQDTLRALCRKLGCGSDQNCETNAGKREEDHGTNSSE
jgi:MarR family 2-MHQ and catechol resistance regulon transcriptional repressor